MSSKYKNFIFGAVGFFLVTSVIGIYQIGSLYAKQEDKIAKLESQVETLRLQQEEYNAAYGALDTKDSETTATGSAGSYADGTYEGSAQGFGGDITLSVTVKGGKISNIEILSAPGEDASYFSMAKAITDSIIEANSPDVDTISGATYSSTGIKNAVITALQEAVNP